MELNRRTDSAGSRNFIFSSIILMNVTIKATVIAAFEWFEGAGVQTSIIINTHARP